MKGIFIVGYPRSGTTLLQSLLGCSSGLTTFKESHLFSRTMATRCGKFIVHRSPQKEIKRFFLENQINTTPRTKSAISNPFLNPKKCASQIIESLDIAAEFRGFQTWLEKTPRHLYYTEIIERAAENSRKDIYFVHIIRDGVSAALSLQKASRAWGQPHSPRQALSRWTSDIKISMKHLNREKHVFVCYEDLVSTPEKASIAVAEKLGLKISANDLKNRSKVTDQIVDPKELWKSNNRKEILLHNNVSESNKDLEIDKLWLEEHINREDYYTIRSFSRRSLGLIDSD